MIIYAASGCHSAPTAEAIRDQISLNIRHGNLKAASSEVDLALIQYGRKSLEWSWRFRILKAHILASQGAASDALEILHDDVPPSLAVTDIPVRKAMLEGMAYRIAQDLPRSEEKLGAAEELASRYQRQLLCEVLNFKGALQVDEQRYPEAEATYNMALKLARENRRPDQEASAQVSLAWVAMKRERFDEAVERGHAALQVARSLEMQGLVAATLGNLGWSYFELGDFESALEFYKDGAEQSERSGLPSYTEYWFSGMANSYIELRDYVSAEFLAKRTLERARSQRNVKTITSCLNTLAEIALETGKLDEAERYNREAIRLTEEGADHLVFLEALRLSGRIATNRGNFDQAERLFRRLIQDRSAETSVRWKAEARLAETHDAENLAAIAEREYRQSLDTIQAARNSIERDDLRVSFLSGGIDFYDDYVDFLIRHKRFADALQVAELSRARTLEEGLASTAQAASFSQKRVQPQQIAQKWKASLLFYWIGHNHSYVWVITPSNTAYFKLPKASEIEPVVKSYRKSLFEMRDVQDTGASAGKQLYAMLVQPAKKLVPQGSRVIVLPAESLYGLNFETLIVPDPKPHFWIEDVTVTTACSLKLLASSATQSSPREKSLLLVGNTEEPSSDFPVLAQAPMEMQKIERYFPVSNRKVLDGKQATPSAYLSSNPERFSYVHFVTHGTSSHTRPLESAVILSREGDSYKLYARDIVQHHLNANLVIISACNGAGTRAYSGEGLVGLSWAFLRAGAHNVIAALWEVSDASTPQLMEALYGELSQGKDPATALRDAKLSMLRANSNTVFKKPYYWAPFQLYVGS